MLTIIAEMYITLVPAILAGIFNMIWCTLPVADCLKKPIDQHKNWRDGRRIFGDNKTWKGFLGMVAFGTLFTLLWGAVCAPQSTLYTHNLLYRYNSNTWQFNAAIGFGFGFMYALFELPNSFLKRRLKIEPGRPPKGLLQPFFIFLDQADSVFGMVLVVALVTPMSLPFYLAYVLLGAATHIVINMLLFAVKLRKNPF